MAEAEVIIEETMPDGRVRKRRATAQDIREFREDALREAAADMLEFREASIKGYARVSTTGQDHAGQVAELKTAGCTEIFREKVSGAKSDRAELAKLLKAIQPGDVVIVTRLDRLARSTKDLLNILDTISKAGAKFRSLKDPWADTTTPHGELMVTILAGLATFERHLIKARTDEGRKRAQDRGVRFGRPSKMTAHQRQEALQRLANGECQADVARSYAVDPATICRLAAQEAA